MRKVSPMGRPAPTRRPARSRDAERAALVIDTITELAPPPTEDPKQATKAQRA